MAYDPGAIDATLAAALGDEPALIAELRGAFVDSVQAALARLEQARTEPEWRESANRLKGLAASFGAVRLMVLAGEAAERGSHDTLTMRKLRRAVERL